MDTAELPKEGIYNLNVETQFITDGDSGLNLLGRFDSHLTSDSSYRVELGFGVVDFQVAGFYKWAPIPDTGNQPAMSVSGGVSLAHTSVGTGSSKKSVNDLSLRAHPIVSKKFEQQFGRLTPYASLPLGLRTADGSTDLTAQLAIGSFLKPTKFKNMSFAMEIGFDLSNTFTYFSLGFTLNMDPAEGLVFN